MTRWDRLRALEAEPDPEKRRALHVRYYDEDTPPGGHEELLLFHLSRLEVTTMHLLSAALAELRIDHKGFDVFWLIVVAAERTDRHIERSPQSAPARPLWRRYFDLIGALNAGASPREDVLKVAAVLHAVPVFLIQYLIESGLNPPPYWEEDPHDPQLALLPIAVDPSARWTVRFDQLEENIKWTSRRLT